MKLYTKAQIIKLIMDTFEAKGIAISKARLTIFSDVNVVINILSLQNDYVELVCKTKGPIFIMLNTQRKLDELILPQITSAHAHYRKLLKQN